MVYRHVAILFFQAVLLLFSHSGFSQCSFDVSAWQHSPSSCQSNGTIKASLSGVSVASGDIDIADAKFGITSTSTPYMQTPVANGGTITGVPPGSYTVTVYAYCRASNTWITKTSSVVQVTGSYSVPDINKIYVQAANIQPSLLCKPTGTIPVHLEGGLPPYTVTLRNIPSTYTGATVFTYPTEGMLTITDLPSGSYTVDVSDHCTYTIYDLPANVGEVIPSYALGTVTSTVSCLYSGVVPIALANGAAPYTITITSSPSSYVGSTSYTVPADGTFEIANLPVGSYTFTVSDKCYSQNLSAQVLDIPLHLSASASSGSSMCGNTGGIQLSVAGGLAPYAIHLTGFPPTYTGVDNFLHPAEGVFALPNLPVGSYTFAVTDACGTQQVSAAIAIESRPLLASLLRKTDANGCDPTGSATVRIEGGQPSYTLSLTSPAPSGYVDPSPLTLAATDALSYRLDGMPAGSYVFEVEDECGEKRELHVTIQSEPLEISVLRNIRTFDCVATGELTLAVSGGKPPYEVVMIAPATAGPYTPTNPPNGGTFVVGSLPAGTYTFAVTDACGASEQVTATISKLVTIFPLDPYAPYMLPLTPADADCKRVRINRNKNATGDLDYYWNKNADRYYEVAFVEDTNIGDSLSWVWQPVADVATVTLSRTYCEMRSQGGYLVAYLRVRGDLLSSCGIFDDRIDIKPVKTSVGTPYNQDCATGFDIKFNQPTNEDGVLCYPYSWKLINEHNVTVKSADGVANANEQVVTQIPFGKYHFEFTDAEGCSWQSDELEYYWSLEPQMSIAITPECSDYTATFTIMDVCPPYSWKLYNGASAVVASESNILSLGVNRTLPHLAYGDTYTLTVTYGNGQGVKSFTIREEQAAFHSYAIDFGSSYCLPDTAKGYIVISRTPATPAFEIGSKLRFIDGATIPAHTEITITDDHIERLYPFSPDSTQQTYQRIMAGLYKFELIDVCGNAYPLSVQYKPSNLKDFGYTLKETCIGLEVYPKGQLYLGTSPQPTYFRICEAPSGVTVSSSSVQSPQFLFLSESGHYVIQVSNDAASTSCPYDTIAVEFYKQSVSLDTEATTAYVCKEGEVGYLKVLRKGGVGPFEYELFDEGISKGWNTEGTFHYGTLGKTYTIRVKDIGCRVSFDQDIELINLSNEKVLYALSQVCFGAAIELHSLPMNSNVYSWTGPANFISLEKDPRIVDAQPENAGIYSLTVHPEGCVEPIQQSVNIDVYQPPAPVASSQAILCLNSPSKVMEAVADPFHRLKWYDSDGVSALSAAPHPDTRMVYTKQYYVSQVSDLLGCESEKVPVEVTVSDLPQPLPSATALPVCPNMFPIFTIRSPQLGYTYKAYTLAMGGVAVGEGIAIGDSLVMRSTYSVSANTTFYIETLDHNECAAPTRTAVSVEVRNPLHILTDILPSYKRGTTYKVQLESNAKSPYVYSAATPLPYGFSLYSTGLITGRVAVSERLLPDTFTVNLVDSAGCVTEKTYQLKSDPFIPQVFTPDGDGTNDHFMKGYHVVIFDRLGVIIFEGKDGWDGSYRGKPAPVDTYFYVLDYGRSDGSTGQSKGYIAVVRGR